MSRINTNTSSLVAQNALARSNSDLQTALSRLSTGLRINVGKDDPAGLIASENLRRDITSLQKAVTNTERANQLIATADSALGQVASLLNDIRGLVTEAANTGAQSQEQIAANQLQVDSSLEAIDRIAQTTTFQGRKLLDGSLSFLTSAGTGFSSVTDLQIDQASLGATGSVDVNVDISAAATQAQITNAAPSTAATEFTLDNRTFTVTASDSSAATVDLVVNANSNNTGTATFDGHTFRLTSSLSQATDITVQTTNANNVADGQITLDATTLDIVAATAVDDVDITIQESNLGATADTDTDLSVGDGTNAFTFALAVGTGYTHQTDDDINVVFAAGGATAANYDTATDTLTVTIDNTGAETRANILAAIDDATIDTVNVGTGTFATSGAAGDANINLNTGSLATNVTGNPELTINQSTAAYSSATNTLTLTLNNQLATIDASDVETQIEALADFASVTLGGSSNITRANLTLPSTLTDAVTRDGVKASYGANTLTLTFDSTNTAVSFTDIETAVEALAEFDTFAPISTTTGTVDGSTQTPLTTRGTLSQIAGAAADFDSTTSTLTLTFDGSDSAVTASEIETAIEGITGGTTFTVTETGTGTIDATALSNTTGFSTIGQVQDLVVEVAGDLGAEVFNFQAGTTFQQIADAISLVSDAIGVTASVVSNELRLESTTYGSAGFVNVDVISEGAGGTFETNLSATRQTGSDVQARVNGFQANGDGNTLSINTSTLDFSLTVTDGSSTDVNFTITGGGAVFQLGPNVVSNQQASVGIESIATGKLGGAAGRLYELRSGNDKALATDATGAASVVDEVITKVSELRGRLGAFQRTTLDSNLVSLNDTIANLTEAESSIRDADFAAESARLTRAQILVQSGTSVLSIANQNPQNVLALLR